MVGIDTITLNFYLSEFVVMNLSRFTPNASTVLTAGPREMGNRKMIFATCNPTKDDNCQFGYLPYLTLYRALRGSGLTTWLRVQFSFPKLTYGNNIDEAIESDFQPCLDRLLAALAFYGVRIYGSTDTLASADVSGIHYAKNLLLHDYVTTQQALQEIRKCNVTAWKDVEETTYKNYGHGWKTHSKNHELAAYEKWAEHHEGQKGKPLFDKDTQLMLPFEEAVIKSLPELLRVEARLNNKKVIKWALERAGLSSEEITFKALFDRNVSQAVLLKHFDDLYQSYPKISESLNRHSVDLFSDLFVQNPDRNITTILQAVGLRLILDEAGVKEMKNIVGPKGAAAFQRASNKISGQLSYRAQKSEVFKMIRQLISEFEPIRLKLLEK